MTQSPETKPDPDEFQDPLENYDAKDYEDPLQQALAEETVAVMQSSPFVAIPSSTTVADAVKKLASLHVACLLIEDDGELVGLFTDRDVLDNVVLEYEQKKDQPVSEVMTKEPVYVFDSDSSAAVLCVMSVSGYRHVPVLSLDKKIVGIVSPQRITEFLQRYFQES